MADQLEFHPLANLFPLMEGEEFDQLVKDIKKNGQRENIVVYEDKILDGRNRYRACLKAGAYPKLVSFNEVYHGKNPRTYVISANLHRRHLTTQQRAAIAAELATMKSGARTDLGSNDARSGMSDAQAAKALKVSEPSVERAKKRMRENPPAHEQAKAGTLPRKKPAAPTAPNWSPEESRAKERELFTAPAGKPQYPGTCPDCGEPFGYTAPVRREDKWYHAACAQPPAPESDPDPTDDDGFRRDPAKVFEDLRERYDDAELIELAKQLQAELPTADPGHKPMSRPKRWADACARATDALQELVDLQQEYQEWREGLPENLEASAVAEKLDAIDGIDFDSAIGVIDEAEQADLPLGFGRD